MSGRIDELLHDLNPAQREAAAHRDGPLLVLAGPGSGKTRVITRRAACLVASGIRPRNVLCITFTNKAASEMRRRVESLGVAAGMWVCTFHAMCARLLREVGPLADVQPGFTIYDVDDQLRVVKSAMETLKLSAEFIRPEQALEIMSRAKNRLLSPEDFASRTDGMDERTTVPIYTEYDRMLREQNALDFDDLLMRVALLLRDHEEVRERLGRRFQYVLIDEYQDTNHAQYLIARLLTQEHRNLCVTGDPDQSIYAWRGADLRNILDFEQDYPDARVVRLEQNYRSTGSVVRVAAALIAANRRRKKKTLWTELPDGDPVELWSFHSGNDEARQIAETITTGRAKGRSYSDFAIFYRINAVSRGLEDALRARGIPYRIARGIEFYGRKEIKDTVAYLRLLVNPADQVALERVINEPPRGIGDRTVERLLVAAAEWNVPLIQAVRRAEEIPVLRGAAAGRVLGFARLMEVLNERLGRSVVAAVNDVLKITGLEDAYRLERDEGGEDRLANVQELVTAAKAYEEETESPSLEDFLQRISLTSDQDRVDESAGVVNLMTLHAAKGLEFPVVFVAAMEEGFLPHERSQRGDLDVEEERRLCFVGVTRAMQRLYLSHATERIIRGAPNVRSPSRFLRDLWTHDLVVREFGGAGSHRHEAEVWRDGGQRLLRESGDSMAYRERVARRPGARRLSAAAEERTFSLDDPTRPLPPAPPVNRFAGWTPGTFVRHDAYGIGTLLWISPGGSQTRAGIRFASHGEKVFILELAPLQKLERPPRDSAERLA